MIRNSIFLLLTLIKLIMIFLFLSSSFEENKFIYFINPISSLVITLTFFHFTKHHVFSFFMFAIDSLLPIIGFVCISIFFLLYPIYHYFYRNRKIDVYEIPLGEKAFSDYSENKRIQIYGRDYELEDVAHDILEIVPYRDIFSGKSLTLKVSAIDKLSQQHDYESIQVLKEALASSEYEVRYFASNALGKIEKKLLEKIELVSEQVEQNSHDISIYNHRGSLYLDIFILDILDDEMKKLFLEKALKDFDFSLNANPNQSFVYTRLVQVHLLLEKYQEVVALTQSESIFELSKEDQGKVLFYLAEAHFNLGNYKEVISTSKKVLECDLNFEKILNSANWWASVGG